MMVPDGGGLVTSIATGADVDGLLLGIWVAEGVENGVGGKGVDIGSGGSEDVDRSEDVDADREGSEGVENSGDECHRCDATPNV